MSDRADFSTETKRLIAARAGYRCALPTCGCGTVGPGIEPDSQRLVGIACHIYSASPGGPRGQNDLSFEQLAAPENGIWLCGTHAALIDKDNGARQSTKIETAPSSLWQN